MTKPGDATIMITFLGRIFVLPSCPVPVQAIKMVVLPVVPDFVALSVDGGPRQIVPVIGEVE